MSTTNTPVNKWQLTAAGNWNVFIATFTDTQDGFTDAYASALLKAMSDAPNRPAGLTFTMSKTQTTEVDFVTDLSGSSPVFT
jgi:hypothetical protein